MSKPTPVSLQQPIKDTPDWHTPLNSNFQKTEDELNSHDRMAGPFFAHEQSNPDMSVRVDPGFVWAGGSLTEKSAQDTANLAAPSSNDRIDRIVYDADDGSIQVQTGSEASSPSPPSVPKGKVPCAQVYLTPSTSQINNSDITDERTYQHGSTLDDLERNLTVSAQEINNHLDTISGRIIMYAGTSEPSGWLFCNGQAVSRTTYSDLFSLISTTFGNGDGSSTFNLPDLRDRVPVGTRDMGSKGDADRIDTYSTAFAANGGEDAHQLTVDELASHSHTYERPYVGSERESGNVEVMRAFTGEFNTGMTGNDQAHNNVQPFLAINYLIKT